MMQIEFPRRLSTYTALALLTCSAIEAQANCPTRIKTGGFPPIEWVIIDGAGGKELAQANGSEIGWRAGSLSAALPSWQASNEHCAANGWNDRSKYDCQQVKNQQPVLDAMRCHLGVTNAPRAGEELDIVTPQVPGCPKYLRKSLVQWRQVGNPQLNTWEIRNVSRQTVKVTFRESGANSSPDTLPAGQTVQVGLTGSQVPPYVVRDFAEIMSFNNSQQRKALECELAIRPR